MRICEENSCTGCLACMDACARHAITVKTNDMGFNIPVIDETECISCKHCLSVCPVNVQKKMSASDNVLACWDKDKSSRLAATSGGVFSALAKKVISDGGAVYGAAFDDKLDVVHIRVDKVNDIQKLRGSKYVQSNTAHIYSEVLRDLETGKKILFSGTPCQVAGLRNFLRKPYADLICIDIMCHGVPSPMVFQDYKYWLEEKYKNKIKKLSFRYKKPGWSIFSMKAVFQNGKEYRASKYVDPFLCFFSLGGVI